MNQQHTDENAGTGANVAETQFGGFWIRVGAYIIDVLVMVIPIMLVSYIVLPPLEPPFSMKEVLVYQMLNALLALLLWWLYYGILESSVWQATVGKKAVGLKVVDEHSERLSFGQASGRYFAKLISSAILSIGYLMVGWTEKKQGLHDMIANTFVAKVEID